MSQGLKTPEGNPAGVGQNLKEERLPLSFTGGAETGPLKPPKYSLLGSRILQFLGVVSIAGASLIPLAAFFDRKSVQAEVLKFSNPAPKSLEVKAGMPSQKLVQTRAPEDTYGPEMTRAQLEAANITITARDYVRDGSRNLIQQWVVLDNRTLYQSSQDPVLGKWPDFIPVYRWPDNINITSLASSSDGSISIAAGVEGHPIYGKAKFYLLADSSRTSLRDLAVPPYFTGSPAELIRLDDKNYWGSILDSVGTSHQFIVKADSTATNAAVVPATIESVVPVNTPVGRLQNTRIISLDAPNRIAIMVSNRLQDGIAVSRLNYGTDIGTANIFTQTKLVDGTIINLGYTYGTGIYTDTLGNLRISTSNFIRNTLYDFNLNNPLDGTGTALFYGNRCDNKGIPDYIPGNLNILALDVSFDPQGNKKTKFGGSGSSSIDGLGRAMFGVIEDSICLQLEHDKQSGVLRQQDMQDMKINNENGTELGIRGLGKAFVDGNLNVYYTDGGLGTSLPEPPVYRLYLTSVVSNSTVITSGN